MSKIATDVCKNEIHDLDKGYYWRGETLIKGTVEWTYDGRVRFEGDHDYVRNNDCILLEKSIGVFKTKTVAGDSVIFRYRGELFEGEVINEHYSNLGIAMLAIRNGRLKRKYASHPSIDTRTVMHITAENTVKVKDGKKSMIKILREHE